MTARSRCPSPVKSPATMAPGIIPTAYVDRGLEGAVAVAQQRSVDGAEHQSIGDGQVEVAVAGEVTRHDGTRDEDLPAAYGTAGWKVPSPLPSKTDTPPGSPPPVLIARRHGEVEVAVAGEITGHDRSSGLVPAAYSTGGWKVPSPLPSSTYTPPGSLPRFHPLPGSTTARSRWPSPVKSPATMACGSSPIGIGWNGAAAGMSMVVKVYVP